MSDHGHRGHDHRAPVGARLRVSLGQSAIHDTVPSHSTSREGRLRAASHARAAGPFTIAAVEAVLASTHDAAATDTVRHMGLTGKLVEGSMMWCT
jgi:hypothetical protein